MCSVFIFILQIPLPVEMVGRETEPPTEGAVLPPEHALGVLVSWKLRLLHVHGVESFLDLGRKGAQNPVLDFPLGAQEPAQLMLSKHCLQALVCAAHGTLGSCFACCAWAWSRVTLTGEGPSRAVCLGMVTLTASACRWNGSGKVFSDWQPRELVILLKLKFLISSLVPALLKLAPAQFGKHPYLPLANVCVIVPSYPAPHCQQQECCCLSVPFQPCAGA